MALGKRFDAQQQDLWITTAAIAKSPGHVFYERLNGVLREAGFDTFVEDLCAPSYAKNSRPSIPPGVNKRYSLAEAAHNLSLVMRKLFGFGQPRSLQGMRAVVAAFFALYCALLLQRAARLTFLTEVCDDAAGRTVATVDPLGFRSITRIRQGAFV